MLFVMPLLAWNGGCPVINSSCALGVMCRDKSGVGFVTCGIPFALQRLTVYRSGHPESRLCDNVWPIYYVPWLS